MICPVHDGLGARINFDGQLIDCKGNIQTGLSTLGRVALGTVIAVDSIHDCFGACRENWVDGVISRAR